MQLKIRPVLGIILLLYGVSLIDSAKGEVCFQDANCTIGEFCNISTEANVPNPNPYRRKQTSGKNVVGICAKCLDCSAFNRAAKRAKSQQCAKNVTDCGICLDEFQPTFSHAGYHLDCLPRNTVNNISALNSSRMVGEREGYEDESLHTTGTIMGGVAIGIVGIAAIAFFGVFGFKYYKGRKQKKNKKNEDQENATTTELQELKPKPLPSINKTPTDPVQSEEGQEI